MPKTSFYAVSGSDNSLKQKIIKKPENSRLHGGTFSTFTAHLSCIKQNIESNNQAGLSFALDSEHHLDPNNRSNQNQPLETLLTAPIETTVLSDRIRQIYECIVSITEHYAVRRVPNSYTLQTRPFIEWLFLKKPKILAEICRAICNKNDISLYHAFVRSLQLTSLNLDNNPSLFIWNKNDASNFQLKISMIELYAQELTSKNVSKGEQAQEVVAGLKELFTASSLRQEENADPNWQTQLSDFAFKLELKQILHSKDKELFEYRGWARLIINTLTCLFGACIPNLINLAASGNFLFFNKVTGKELVQAAETQLLLPTFS